jgi:hypothetical protein
MPSGALTLGGATTDKADNGVIAATDNLDPITVLAWVKFNTLTSNRVIWSKGSNVKVLRLSGTAGDVQAAVVRTSSSGYITNNAPIVVGTWCFVAFIFNSAAAAGEIINIYSGRVGIDATECTYGTVTDGSGTITSEAGVASAWGNNAGTSTNAMQGDIAFGAVFAGALSLADIISWQNKPRQVVSSRAAADYKAFGLYGADAIDFGANSNPTLSGTLAQAAGPGIQTPIDYVQTVVTAGAGNLWHLSDSRLNAKVSAWKDALGANNGRAAGLTFAQATGGSQPSIANERFVFSGTKLMETAQDTRLAYDGAGALFGFVIVKATANGPILTVAQTPSNTAVAPYAGIQVAGGNFKGFFKPTAGSTQIDPDSDVVANDGVIRIIYFGKGSRAGTFEDEAWRLSLRGRQVSHHEQNVVATTVAGGLIAALGELGGARGTFEICAVGFLAADPSPALQTAIDTYGNTFLQAAVPETSKTGTNIVLGDSNCVGTATTDRLTAAIGSGTKSWPYIYAQDTTNPHGLTLVQEGYDVVDIHKLNVSHGGNNIDDLLAALPRTLGMNGASLRTGNHYVLVWCIGGSALIKELSFTTLKARWITLLAALHGYGVKLCTITCTDGGTLGAGGFGLYSTVGGLGKSAEGQAVFDFEAELAANTATYTDALISMTGLSQVAPFNRACDNTSYFNGDKVHHLDAATALDGPYIRARFAAITAPTGTSVLALPLSGSATGAVSIVGASALALPLGGAAVGAVAVVGASVAPLPLGGSAAGTNGARIGASVLALPLGGSATGAVAIVGASARPLPLALSATAINTAPTTALTGSLTAASKYSGSLTTSPG